MGQLEHKAKRPEWMEGDIKCRCIFRCVLCSKRKKRRMIKISFFFIFILMCLTDYELTFTLKLFYLLTGDYVLTSSSDEVNFTVFINKWLSVNCHALFLACSFNLDTYLSQ